MNGEWTQWHACIDFMKTIHKTEFVDGLTDDEFEAAEGKFDFRFPPDLREFLSIAMPVKHKTFPNWRNLDCEDLAFKFRWPLEGILFDVEKNHFWLEKWGDRPDELSQALEIATKHVKAAPKLIPVYGHRMIPERPHQKGNPVLSVHQCDIIYYGINLRDYLIHEFATTEAYVWPIPDDVTPIEFWDDIVHQRGWAPKPRSGQ